MFDNDLIPDDMYKDGLDPESSEDGLDLEIIPEEKKPTDKWVEKEEPGDDYDDEYEDRSKAEYTPAGGYKNASENLMDLFFGVGETNLELLQSTSPDGPIGKFIEKNAGRGGIHHICIQVEDIEVALAEYKKAGVLLIDEKPRVGAHGKLIAFVHPKSTGGVLLEVSQDPLNF